METNDDPLYKDVMKKVPEGKSPREYVTSLRLVATMMLCGDIKSSV